LGIDINGQPVLVAASDYVAAGGGSGISHDGSTADGVLTYKDSDEATVESNLTFDGSTLTVAGDILVNQYIKHGGDTNTHINFTDDKIVLKAGNISMVKMEEKASAPHEVTINDGSNNIDFVVKGNGSNAGNPLFACDASTGRVGINGVGSPAYELDVAGDIGLSEHIYHKGDDDTFIRFDDDTIILKAGGWSMFKALPSSGSILVNNGGHDLDFIVKAAGSGSLIYTDAGDSIVCISTDSSAGGVGADANFYVSGTIGAKAAGDRGVSVFAGDVVVSGTLNVESQLTASNGIQISNVPTGSLAGPASFLGLDTGGRVIQVAASDYVSAGDSGDSFQVRLVGRFKISSTNTARHFTHTQGMSNAAGGDYNTQRTEAGTSDTSFTSTPRQALDYYAVSVAPYSCTLESVTNIAELRYKYSNSPAWRVWKGTYTNNSTGNVTWTEILPATSWTSGGSGTDQDDVMVYDRTTLSSDNSFNAGDLIGFTWQTGGSTASGFNSFIATMNFKGA
jgi:hypothetical protein